MKLCLCCWPHVSLTEDLSKNTWLNTNMSDIRWIELLQSHAAATFPSSPDWSSAEPLFHFQFDWLCVSLCESFMQFLSEMCATPWWPEVYWHSALWNLYLQVQTEFQDNLVLLPAVEGRGLEYQAELCSVQCVQPSVSVSRCAVNELWAEQFVKNSESSTSKSYSYDNDDQCFNKVEEVWSAAVKTTVTQFCEFAKQTKINSRILIVCSVCVGVQTVYTQSEREQSSFYVGCVFL